jgi:hypothetical protein
VNARTYRIVMTVEPEKLQGLSTGSNRGEIAIVTEAAPEPSTLKLPITLFVRE